MEKSGQQKKTLIVVPKERVSGKQNKRFNEAKPLLVTAKKIINNVNKQKGHKAANEKKIISKKRSVAFKTAHELCVKYLCADYEETANKVSEKDIYWYIKDIKEENSKLRKQDY